MCGRYTDTRRKKAMLASLGLQADLAFVPRYNIAPTQEASIVALAADGTPEHKLVRWGLLPYWAKDESSRLSMINARCETVAEKPAFKHAYRNRRCLVLADGFYEWSKRVCGKQPIYIRMREGSPFAFGGLREEWRDGERLVESFCIVTTTPNQLCATIHDRMPLILKEADFAAWLDAKTAPQAVDALMKPFAAAPMECFPVSTTVNNVHNEIAACLERVTVDAHGGQELSPQMMLPF